MFLLARPGTFSAGTPCPLEQTMLFSGLSAGDKVIFMDYIKIILPYRLKNSVLALGAQSKSAFCLADGNVAYLSEAGGDLSELGNFRSFERHIRAARKKFRVKPKIIACDLHPEYISAKYADELARDEGLRIKKIQHHEAHVASCMADNNVKGEIIGVAFDGTGFGPDGNIWGGEFFIGGFRGFARAGHLRYMPMPGGEACVREPWRMALSYLHGVHDKDMSRLKINRENTNIAIQMIAKNINSPLTSSAGRLFYAVSALIGICGFAKYEGEAAVKLEKEILVTRSQGHKVTRYKFDIIKDKDIFIIEPGPVIKGIIRDLDKKIPPGVISLKFHDAVCGMIKDVCVLLRKRYRISRVCLSGGVFQNRYLSGRVGSILGKSGFKAYLHKNIPTHDGGIPLGQAIIAGLS